MGKLPMPISVSRGHFALRYEVPKFLARGGHLCMAMLTITADEEERQREEAERALASPVQVDVVRAARLRRLAGGGEIS